MTEINHKGLEFMLGNSYVTALPMYVQGGIGIGKSQTVEKFAKEMAEKEGREYVEWNKLSKKTKLEMMAEPKKYFAFVDQRALMLDLGDFRLPKYNDVGGFEWCIPLVYQYLCSDDVKAILFLDEFNLAPPSIQGMFYSIINDRTVGENHISDGVYMVAAGNRAEDRAATYEMPMPLRNRFIHVTLADPVAEEWAKWAFDHEIDRRIISFLQFKPKMMYAPDDSAHAFPTPRSWEKCSKGIKKLNKYDQLKMVADASIGEGCATEFLAFIKLTEKVDLEDILNNPESVKKIEEPQMLFSIASGMVEKFRADNKKLGKIVKVGDNMRAEYTLWMLKMIKENCRDFRKLISSQTDVQKFAEQYGKYLID